MGWSARVEACETMDAWTAACVAQTGSQNVYEANGNRYFWEIGREQADGSITGTVFLMVGEDQAFRQGSFKIDGDGHVVRWATGLKSVVANYGMGR